MWLVPYGAQTSAIHLPHICHSSATRLPHIRHTFAYHPPTHLPHICHTSATHLPQALCLSSLRRARTDRFMHQGILVLTLTSRSMYRCLTMWQIGVMLLDIALHVVVRCHIWPYCMKLVMLCQAKAIILQALSVSSMSLVYIYLGSS